MKRIITFLFVLPIFLFSQGYIEQGDSLIAVRDSVKTIKDAISLYEKELNSKPYEAGWRIMKSIYYFSKHEEMPKVQRVKEFQKGINMGEEMVKKYPKGVEAHFWLGVLYGVYGEERGVMKSLFLIKPIKKEMKAVLSIDSKYDCGGAYRVLGRLYYKVPGLFGGSKSKSLSNLMKAKEICPRDLLTRLYLAETLKAMHRKEQARKLIEESLKIEASPDEKPEEKDYKERMRKLLEKL